MSEFTSNASSKKRKTMSPFKASIQEERDNAYNLDSECDDMTKDEIVDMRNAISLPFVVACFNLNGTSNMSVIMRTAEIMGCNWFAFFGRRWYDKRATIGSHAYLNTQYIDDVFDLDMNNLLDSTINKGNLVSFFITHNLIPVFIELPKDDSVPHELCHKVDWCGLYEDAINTESRICFVLGNESLGIPDDVLKYCCEHVKSTRVIAIQQRGLIRSHNVASAGTIVISDFYHALLRADVIV